MKTYFEIKYVKAFCKIFSFIDIHAVYVMYY